MGQTSADLMSKSTSAVVKDLAEVRKNIRYSLEDFGQESIVTLCLAGLQLLQLLLDLRFGTVYVCYDVSTSVDDNRIGYVINVLNSENITNIVIEFSGHFLIIGHQVPIRKEHVPGLEVHWSVLIDIAKEFL